MRRLVVLLGVAGLFAFFAQQAAAGTASVSVSMSFTEPIAYDYNSGCPAFFEDGFCGMGVILPFGGATETIVFGGACGGDCDLRTVTVRGDSIFIHEIADNFQCPGACQTGNGIGEPFAATLTDEVVGGTGIFAGATGNLSGRVIAAGLQSAIKLSGTIVLDT